MEFIKPYKLKWSFEHIFKGPPVPYTRMTRGDMWKKAAQNYLGYRNALADDLRVKYLELQIPKRPGKEEKKADRLWLKEVSKRKYLLGTNVWFVADNADWSNGLKVIEDALQCAGLIWNDKRISQNLGGIREVDNENPRIEFLFGELE